MCHSNKASDMHVYIPRIFDFFAYGIRYSKKLKWNECTRPLQLPMEPHRDSTLQVEAQLE